MSSDLPGTRQRPKDNQNYVLFLKELRRQLDTVTDKKYLLTVALVRTMSRFRVCFAVIHSMGAGATQIGDLDLPGMAA